MTSAASQNDSICAQCVRLLGRSCCEVSDDERLATLTLSDIERIEDAGISRSRFVEEQWLTTEEALEYEDARPAYRGYFRHGPSRLTLRRNGTGCVFLDKKTGCTLDAATRPTACRLYPLEPRALDGPTLVPPRYGDLDAARTSGGCLAAERATTVRRVARLLGVRQAEVDALSLRLADEIRDHARRTAPVRGGRRRR
jgi:uncharacterized protein